MCNKRSKKRLAHRIFKNSPRPWQAVTVLHNTYESIYLGITQLRIRKASTRVGKKEEKRRKVAGQKPSSARPFRAAGRAIGSPRKPHAACRRWGKFRHSIALSKHCLCDTGLLKRHVLAALPPTPSPRLIRHPLQTQQHKSADLCGFCTSV